MLKISILYFFHTQSQVKYRINQCFKRRIIEMPYRYDIKCLIKKSLIKER